MENIKQQLFGVTVQFNANDLIGIKQSSLGCCNNVFAIALFAFFLIMISLFFFLSTVISAKADSNVAVVKLLHSVHLNDIIMLILQSFKCISVILY